MPIWIGFVFLFGNKLHYMSLSKGFKGPAICAKTCSQFYKQAKNSSLDCGIKKIQLALALINILEVETIPVKSS